MNWQMLPRRAEGIEINEVIDGFVLYDPRRDRLHHLNATAILVLELCDGTTRAEELPQLLATAFRLPAPPVDEVEACLTRLLGEGLLTDPGASLAG